MYFVLTDTPDCVFYTYQYTRFLHLLTCILYLPIHQIVYLYLPEHYISTFTNAVVEISFSLVVVRRLFFLPCSTDVVWTSSVVVVVVVVDVSAGVSDKDERGGVSSSLVNSSTAGIDFSL